MGLFIGDVQPSKIFVGDTPISKCFLGDTQVRPTGWQPGANTVAYYPLNGDINDYSGNSRNLTVATGSMSYGNLTDGQYGIFNGNTMLSTSDIVTLNSGTILMWAFFGSVSDGNLLSNCKGTASSNYANYGAIDGNNKIFFPYTEGSWGSSNRLVVSQTGIVPTNAWILHAVTNDGTTLSYYKNGSYITGKTSTMFLNMTDATLWCIGGLKYGSQYLSKLQGGMSNIIIEDKARTAQEILDYYNSTKDNYPQNRDVENYTLSNIATNDTNKYINVAKSGYTIQSVKFNFITTGRGAFVHISSNNSNSSRYGVATGHNTSGSFGEYCAIRGRLNGASDTWYRQEGPYNSGTSNTIEFYINRDGNCYISINGTKNSYTAGSVELNIIQTIMNLSNMNCYASQYGSLITGNSIDIEVTYTKDNYSTTLNSLQNINLTPTNEINITPNNNGSGNVQSI